MGALPPNHPSRTGGTVADTPRRQRRPSVFAVAVVVVVALASVVAIAGPSPTASQDLGQALTRAQAAVAKKAWLDVIKALGDGLAVSRHEAPLVITQVVVVDAPHTGLGAWRALPGGVVRAGKLMLYVEVENLDTRAAKDGRRQLSFEVKGLFSSVEDNGTLTPIGTKNLGTQTLDLWRSEGVHSFGLDVAMGQGAPPGRYVVELEVNDLIGGKSARRSAPFVLQP